LLDVRNLRVEFPTRRGVLVAVDDVSFSIAHGEVLGVVGESGAGKSLTGAAIIGLLEPPGRIAAGRSCSTASASTACRTRRCDAYAGGASARSSRIRSHRSTPCSRSASSSSKRFARTCR
jgi:ABC-type dipeptide/oligopeptide/nickel transport system ATPase component